MELKKLSNKTANLIEKAVQVVKKSNNVIAHEEQEETGSKMLKVMDWAMEKATGNIPGLGSANEMANKYLEKYGSVHKAIDKLIAWQITSAATAGFVTNLGGLPAMPITLPANVVGVMAIQLRMIGAIAELGGHHENTEEKRTGMYLCLLGSQAGDVLSKTSSQVAIKFATSALKRLPGDVLTKINQQVGFRLFTKFGEHGLLNLHKAIPVIGGIVGGSIDAFSTYAIAKAAKALFLNEIIEFEKQEQLEANKVRLLINLLQIDSNDKYNEKKELIRTILFKIDVSDKVRNELLNDIECPKKFNVDLEPFKNDLMLSSTTLYALYQVASLGDISPVETIYIKQLAKKMECPDEIVNDILQSQLK